MASLLPHTGPLGRRLAAHLLRRATFGPTRAEIDTFAALTADQAVDQLMNFPLPPAHPEDPQTGQTWVLAGRTTANSPNDELKYIIGSWWLHQVMQPGQAPTLFHKLVFFLHTCFPTSFRDIEWSENHYYLLRLFMLYAAGDFKELAFKVCLDNGMNEFLDIGDSVAGNPNENFVREFFELHTVGKGPGAGPGDYTTFTEQDVIEAARLLTGFRLNTSWADVTRHDPDTGMPRAWLDPSRHDDTDKLFSHRFQNHIIAGQNTEAGMLLELQQFVDMIFNQTETARHLVRRMYRFFVRYQIDSEVETDIIDALAADIMTNGYDLDPVIRKLLKSRHFYDADDTDSGNEIVGALIKSPLELQAGMMRFLDLSIPDPAADLYAAYVTFYRWGMWQPMHEACFDLFAPEEVAGYQPVYQAPEYNRLWIGAKSIQPRYAFADELLYGPDHLRADVMAWVNNPANVPDFPGTDPLGNPGPHPGPRIATHLLDTFIAYLLPEDLPPLRRDYFLQEILLDNLSPINWMFEWDNYVATGDDTNVKPQIEKLFRALFQSVEYQLG
ncbi:MAG: DUF1800 family protein [Bacteroidetes bacterium]|nr:MAG: DUF1800 family protein [Bacteroidota bacterium]